MDGSEVGGGGDSVICEDGLDARTVERFRKANDVDEPADAAVGDRERWEDEARNICEESVIVLGSGAAQSKDFVDAAELDTAEGAGDVGEAIVEADVGVIEPAGC